jgi:hypothetical protein
MNHIDERILRLAQDSPIVYHYMTHIQRGNLSYEQALVECVLALAKVNQSQFNMLVKEAQSKPYSDPFLDEIKKGKS